MPETHCKYTGKERDVESQYDCFGARYYDARIGRWLGVEPLAEKYPGWSPYNYALDNAICLKDPNGKWVVDVIVCRWGKYVVATRTSLSRYWAQEATGALGLIDRMSRKDPSVGIPTTAELLWSALGGKYVDKIVPAGEAIVKLFDAATRISCLDDAVRAMHIDQEGFNMLLAKGILSRKRPALGRGGEFIGVVPTDDTDELIVNPEWMKEKELDEFFAEITVNTMMIKHWLQRDPALYARRYGSANGQGKSPQSALNPAFDAWNTVPPEYSGQ